MTYYENGAYHYDMEDEIQESFKRESSKEKDLTIIKLLDFIKNFSISIPEDIQFIMNQYEKNN